MTDASSLRDMARRALFIAAALPNLAVPAPVLAQADTAALPSLAVAAAVAPASGPMTVELGKTRLIELPRDVAEVVLSNSTVVEAVVRTPRRVHLLGLATGAANAVFIGRDGARLLALDITVERDLAPVAAAIRRLVPGANVRLESVNDNIVLAGTAPSPLDASRIADIAARFTPKREQVLNMLDVAAKEQVLLRVTVAEVNRSVIRRLGVDMRELLTSGHFAVGKLVQGAFPASGGVIAGAVANSALGTLSGASAGLTAGAGWSDGRNAVIAVLQMLERNGLARTLAEPNLTAISGETADFLAGGEYPVPVASEKDTTTVAFKPFGVKLAFTPVVLSEGRISLKVATEVSELTSEGAVAVNSIAIPALKVRRASSTLELPSGGSLVMAGLISSHTRKNIDALPGVRDLPVLGALFRSDDFLRSESEMVVIATPFIVAPAARHDLQAPGEVGAVAASGKDAVALSASPAGDGFGFIIE